jgi:hypothetical protein
MNDAAGAGVAVDEPDGEYLQHADGLFAVDEDGCEVEKMKCRPARETQRHYNHH